MGDEIRRSNSNRKSKSSNARFKVGTTTKRCHTHRCSQGGPKGPCTPKFLENVVILCFERNFSKQNSVIRSNILAPPKFLGWLHHWSHTVKYSIFKLALTPIVACDFSTCQLLNGCCHKCSWQTRGFRNIHRVRL